MESCTSLITTSYTSQETLLAWEVLPGLCSTSGSYLVGDDCLVLVHSGLLATTELASPASGDSASPNATQGTPEKLRMSEGHGR